MPLRLPPLEPPRISAALAAALLPLLTACAVLRPGPDQGVLSVAVGIGPDTYLDAEQRSDTHALIESLERSFAIAHPGVTLRLQMFSDQEIVSQLAHRHANGLGPDLLAVHEQVAFELHARGLSRPLRLSPRALADLDPGALQRVRLPDGRLSAMPLMIQPELACFDRRRLARSPASLDTLLAASADGLRVGLPLEPQDLGWTFGSLGSREAFLALRPGQPLSAAQRQRIARWFAWMKAADLQHRFNFLPNRQALEEDMLKGRLDWISCRSSQLSRLRRGLGQRLGVAVLPSGPGGPPSPVSSLRLIALGTDSSPVQRRLAERLALFSINPQLQNSFTIIKMALLPVNRQVPVPQAGSEVLASLVRSHQLAARGDALGSLLQPGSATAVAIRQELLAYLYGDSDAEQASTRLIARLTTARPGLPGRGLAPARP